MRLKPWDSYQSNRRKKKSKKNKPISPNWFLFSNIEPPEALVNRLRQEIKDTVRRKLTPKGKRWKKPRVITLTRELYQTYDFLFLIGSTVDYDGWQWVIRQSAMVPLEDEQRYQLKIKLTPFGLEDI